MTLTVTDQFCGAGGSSLGAQAAHDCPDCRCDDVRVRHPGTATSSLQALTDVQRILDDECHLSVERVAYRWAVEHDDDRGPVCLLIVMSASDNVAVQALMHLGPHVAGPPGDWRPTNQRAARQSWSAAIESAMQAAGAAA